jgi:phage repressor protein C with HTH and peptisase S24 domain
VNDESIVDYLAFSREWIRTHVGCDPKHLALIEVTGDSMQPTLLPNDLILLDTRKDRAVSDGVYVIQLNSSLLVKRIHIQLSGAVEVMSDNAAYRTEVVSRDQLTALTIVGRVVWHGKKF